jgi:hypothetical protein
VNETTTIVRLRQSGESDDPLVNVQAGAARCARCLVKSRVRIHHLKRLATASPAGLRSYEAGSHSAVGPNIVERKKYWLCSSAG